MLYHCYFPLLCVAVFKQFTSEQKGEKAHVLLF